MEILQYIIAIFLGLWSPIISLESLDQKTNPATGQSCGRGCDC